MEKLQMYKPDLQKAAKPEIKLSASTGSQKKQENSRKTFTSASSTMLKPLTAWSQQTVENSSRDGNTRPPDLPPEKSVCRSRSKRSSLGIDWFQIGRLYIGQPAYLTYMQRIS